MDIVLAASVDNQATLKKLSASRSKNGELYKMDIVPALGITLEYDAIKVCNRTALCNKLNRVALILLSRTRYTFLLGKGLYAPHHKRIGTIATHMMERTFVLSSLKRAEVKFQVLFLKVVRGGEKVLEVETLARLNAWYTTVDIRSIDSYPAELLYIISWSWQTSWICTII
jgi:hypothetical protein